MMLLRMLVALSSGSSSHAHRCLNTVLQLQEEYSIFSSFAFFCECDSYAECGMYDQTIGLVLKLFVVLVPSIHNICKDQMYYYNWVISGDMFQPLSGHSRASKE